MGEFHPTFHSGSQMGNYIFSLYPLASESEYHDSSMANQMLSLEMLNLEEVMLRVSTTDKQLW